MTQREGETERAGGEMAARKRHNIVSESETYQWGPIFRFAL